MEPPSDKRDCSLCMLHMCSALQETHKDSKTRFWVLLQMNYWQRLEKSFWLTCFVSICFMSLGKILLISEEFLKNIWSYFNYLAAQLFHVVLRWLCFWCSRPLIILVSLHCFSWPAGGELPVKSMTSDDFMVLFSTFTEYNMMITLSKVQIKVKDEDNAAVFQDWVMSCYCAAVCGLCIRYTPRLSHTQQQMLCLRLLHNDHSVRVHLSYRVW